MDGTYNNPFAQGQSPLTPDTPTPGSYQVNINRKKTRKWVEAKVQNYDGDDWGADESEDDEPAPPPPVSRVTTGLRSVGQRLPSEQNRPSPRLAAAAAVGSSSRSSSGPPSLHLQTEHASAVEAEHAASPIHTVPAHVQDAARNPASPIGGRKASPAPLPSQVPSVAGFQAEARSSTPHSTTSSTPTRSSPLVRPSDLYRHVEDDRKAAGSPQSTMDTTVPKPVERFTPPSEEVSQQVTNAPAPFAAIEKRELVVDAYPPVDRTRSVSPKLPDVNRMSVFGSDFFSTSNNETQDPVKQDQPKILEPPVTEASSGKSAAQQPESTVGSQSQQGEHPAVLGRPLDNSQPAVDTKSQPPIMSLPDPRSIPPLRTPSPHTKGSAPPLETHNAATSQASGTPTQALGPDITPTEPLQPRRLDSSASDFQPQPLIRESTLNTVTSSPVKDSDMLSDEIMRTLSPAGTAPTPSPLGETSNSLAPVDRRDTRNSSYTLSDYDSYWEDATEKPGPGEKGGEPVNAPVPSGAQGSQVAVRPTDTPSSTVSALAPSSDDNEVGSQEHPDLRKRFSWEAGFEPNVKVLKGEPPADGSSKAVPRINTPSSLGQSDIQSPKDVVSDVTSPAVDTPKIARTPGDISQQPSMLSIGPQTQLLPSMLEPPSPVSTRTDESIAPSPENRRQSVGNEKMLVETPSHTVSMTPPPEDRPTTSTAPAPPPGQLSGVMGFKEIMGLSNPAQRIAKYEESQRAFAVAETGLDNWIISLKNQYPEYANATASFSGTSAQITVPGGSVAGSIGSNPSTQQPYYQQYLNASSPSVNAPPASSRTRIGGLPIPPQAASAFGNSSNQIGTKGKELMHSAGKMGKGLFSKGRSKLRGTGDKVFH